MGFVANPFILFSSGGVPSTPSEMIFGYEELDFARMNGATGDTWSAYDGDIDEPQNASAISFTNTGFVETGYDFSWANPSGLTIHILDIWGSNNSGYVQGANPSDLVIGLYGWNGSSWSFLGDTGTFTDGTTANKKTIASSDTTTLFTKWKVRLTFTGSYSARIAEMKCFTAGSVQIDIPNLDGKNITPGIETNTNWGRSMAVVEAIDFKPETDCLASAGANNSDLVIEIVFDKARPINSVDIFSSSDDGFFNGSNPTDMQIDIAGKNATWFNIGGTGTFTDANSLKKTVASTDTATLFTALRVVISSASVQRKICSRIRPTVLI